MRLNGRNKLDFKYKIIISVVIIIFILIILNFTVNRDKLSNVELLFKGIANKTQSLFKSNETKTIDKSAYIYKVENESLKKELEELKSVLELKSTYSEYEEIVATVIHRNVGYWYDNVTINKGSKDGIKNGMLVMSNLGLIGRIINVTKHSSDVALLTSSNDNNKITVEILYNDKSVYGLIDGYDHENNEIIVNDIIDDIDMNNDIRVVTSGLTKSYPRGVLIGHVTKVELDEYGLSKVVGVRPSANFRSINYVIILKEKE